MARETEGVSSNGDVDHLTLARISRGAPVVFPGDHFPMIPAPVCSGCKPTINGLAQTDINHTSAISLLGR
ncbi:hypothetical protein Hanom_Chr02g00115361 [Helianthus anomalus]